jgi:chemotaxis protein methyltransferase CheR
MNDAATWTALAERIDREIGLYFPAARRADLERGVAAAVAALSPGAARPADPLACARWLLSVPWTRRHTDALVQHLAIGETYFFRDRPSFDALETHILPRLLRDRASTRRLRIWSAGCSTGEEPYSIAMMLERAIPDIERWNISILATDIDVRSLARAECGCWGQWSFRETRPAEREAFFSPDGRGRWTIAPRLRGRVELRYLNLVQEPFPSVENGTNAMDVIFCRNVLMYFEQGRALQVLRKLERSLRDDGWLFLNPVEMPHVSLPELVPVHFGGAIVHRKRAAVAPAPTGRPPSPAAIDAAPPQIVVPRRPEPPAREDPPRDETPDAATLARHARECADRGELELARTWCERAVRADTLDARSHYLLANVLQELRQTDAAADELRRTLYLEPRHVLAHYALGNLARRQGRSQESLRHFRNALRAIDTWAPDEAARAFEGMDVTRLAQVIRASMSDGGRR